MIIIKKNENNTVTFTLNEKISLTNPYYILELYSNLNRDNKLVSLINDTSVNTLRWNEFKIEENEIEDLANGIISLDVGTYDYFVWESTVDDLDTSLAKNIVESGKCKVIGDKINPITFTDSKTEYTFK